MSRSLGPILPDALVARLTAPAAVADLSAVVVVATMDPFGWPHPALVSYAELLAIDATRLRLALYDGTRSTRNLRDTGRATLIFADRDLILYVKAEAVGLPEAPGHAGLARFELLVREILEDRAEGDEAGARLASGLTVSWPGGPSAAAARFAHIRHALGVRL